MRCPGPGQQTAAPPLPAATPRLTAALRDIYILYPQTLWKAYCTLQKALSITSCFQQKQEVTPTGLSKTAVSLWRTCRHSEWPAWSLGGPQRVGCDGGSSSRGWVAVPRSMWPPGSPCKFAPVLPPHFAFMSINLLNITCFHFPYFFFYLGIKFTVCLSPA